MAALEPLLGPLLKPIARALTAPGVGGGFNPASLFAAGEKGIALDLTDMSKLFQNRERTTAVTATGQPIGSATDLSGNNAHPLAAANDTTRPTFNGWATFDGSNDSLSTPSLTFSGTDKATVVAAVTKASDATAGAVCEFVNISNPGSMRLAAPRAAAADSYGAFLRGSTGQVDYNSGSGYAAPNSAVLSLRMNIGAATSAEEIIMRINGAVVGTAGGGPAGGGNFADGSLFIGSRLGSSTFFNGNIIRLIWISRLLSDAELQRAEEWCGAFF